MRTRTKLDNANAENVAPKVPAGTISINAKGLSKANQIRNTLRGFGDRAISQKSKRDNSSPEKNRPALKRKNSCQELPIGEKRVTRSQSLREIPESITSIDVNDECSEKPNDLSATESVEVTANKVTDNEDNIRNWNGLSFYFADENLKRLYPYPPSLLQIEYDQKSISEIHLSAVYAHEIFTFLKLNEGSYKALDYFQWQTNINSDMRMILNDWLIEIQETLEMTHETIYLAVKIIDHYLMQKVISKSEYQLVGITALFIACKYDERLPPPISDFLTLCRNSYTKEQMIKLELDILKNLRYDLNFPLSYRFLRRYSNVQGNSFKVLTMARFVLELSLLGHEFSLESDSKIAAASLLIAHLTLNSGVWCDQVRNASGYERSELVATMIKLYTHFIKMHKFNAANVAKDPQKELAIFIKYSHPCFCEVAKLPLLDIESIQ